MAHSGGVVGIFLTQPFKEKSFHCACSNTPNKNVQYKVVKSPLMLPPYRLLEGDLIGGGEHTIQHTDDVL